MHVHVSQLIPQSAAQDDTVEKESGPRLLIIVIKVIEIIRFIMVIKVNMVIMKEGGPQLLKHLQLQ